ncbi:hypothetical protein P3S67_026859 [Capsicum chacoense]
MIGEEEALPPEEIKIPEPPDLIIEGEIQQEVLEAICLSSLSDNNQGVNSILVKGSVKNRTLAVLIDSGSTHSFIDEQAVSDTGYVAEYGAPKKVTVADGNYVMCHTTCTFFCWKIEGKPFKEDLRIIDLGGCDLVLGNDWMNKYNPTKFDHEKRCVTIGRKNNKTALHAIPMEGSLSMISGSTMGTLIKKGQTLIAHLFMLGCETTREQENLSISNPKRREVHLGLVLKVDSQVVSQGHKPIMSRSLFMCLWVVSQGHKPIMGRSQLICTGGSLMVTVQYSNDYKDDKNEALHTQYIFCTDIPHGGPAFHNASTGTAAHTLHK